MIKNRGLENVIYMIWGIFLGICGLSVMLHIIHNAGNNRVAQEILNSTIAFSIISFLGLVASSFIIIAMDERKTKHLQEQKEIDILKAKIKELEDKSK